MYIYIDIFTYIYILSTNMFTYEYIDVNTYIYINKYIYTYTFVYIYKYFNTCRLLVAVFDWKDLNILDRNVETQLAGGPKYFYLSIYEYEYICKNMNTYIHIYVFIKECIHICTYVNK
jgi:hypothetical protein